MNNQLIAIGNALEHCSPNSREYELILKAYNICLIRELTVIDL